VHMARSVRCRSELRKKRPRGKPSQARQYQKDWSRVVNSGAGDDQRAKASPGYIITTERGIHVQNASRIAIARRNDGTMEDAKQSNIAL
jgi:hypothetical protein